MPAASGRQALCHFTSRCLYDFATLATGLRLQSKKAEGKHHELRETLLHLYVRACTCVCVCMLGCWLVDCSCGYRPLVSYGFGNLHWAAAHVASMAGAFCAGIAVYSFRAANDEIPGWQVCISFVHMYTQICICMHAH